MHSRTNDVGMGSKSHDLFYLNRVYEMNKIV